METNNNEKPKAIVLEPWQGRLIEEYNELHERIEKLAKFINDSLDKGSTLSEYEINNLVWQFDAMALYVGCLGRRIKFYCPNVELDLSYGYTETVAEMVDSTLVKLFDEYGSRGQLNLIVTPKKNHGIWIRNNRTRLE